MTEADRTKFLRTLLESNREEQSARIKSIPSSERLEFLSKLLEQRRADAIAVLEAIDKSISQASRIVRVKPLRQLVRNIFEFNERLCPRCDTYQPSTEFYDSKRFGKLGICRQCRKLIEVYLPPAKHAKRRRQATLRQRQYRQQNRQKSNSANVPSPNPS